MARLLPPFAVLLLALSPAAPVPPPVGPVKALALDPPEFTDLADLLHVVRRSGRVELAADAPKGRLEVEIYRAGKRQAVHSVGYDQSSRPGASRAVRFAVQAADLDYLPLGAGSWAGPRGPAGGVDSPPAVTLP
jgi:hypothetical protein